MSQLKKLERSQKFNTDEFNLKFEEEDNKSIQETNNNEQKPNIKIETNNNKSNIYINDLGLNMKNLFFEILEILINKQNPISYIMENEKRQFTFSIMILIIGCLLLFLSNLMINN
jgi:hypothetical protein